MRASPSRLHLDLSISFPNTLTLRVRDSTWDFMGDTVKSTAPFSCVKAMAYGKLNSPSQNVSSSSFICSWVKSFPKLHKHETESLWPASAPLSLPLQIRPQALPMFPLSPLGLLYQIPSNLYLKALKPLYPMTGP